MGGDDPGEMIQINAIVAKGNSSHRSGMNSKAIGAGVFRVSLRPLHVFVVCITSRARVCFIILQIAIGV